MLVLLDKFNESKLKRHTLYPHNQLYLETESSILALPGFDGSRGTVSQIRICIGAPAGLGIGLGAPAGLGIGARARLGV